MLSWVWRSPSLAYLLDLLTQFSLFPPPPPPLSPPLPSSLPTPDTQLREELAKPQWGLKKKEMPKKREERMEKASPADCVCVCACACACVGTCACARGALGLRCKVLTGVGGSAARC